MSGFRPLEGGIPIDPEHSLDQITSPFQSIRNGLPELIKNSKDQYARLNITAREERQIIVMFLSNRQHIAVLDFAGATSEEFEGWFTWSSRVAGRRHLADEIEAGHGNGGKAFMVRGGLDQSFIYSSINGNRTQMGFDNSDANLRYRPGHFTDESDREIKNISDISPLETLKALLKSFGTSFDSLPSKAKETFLDRQAFTLVLIKRVSELVTSNRRQELIGLIGHDLRRHPQAAWTIDSCSVWLMDGRDLLARQPLQVESLDPMSGFERPYRYPLPEVLIDPDTEEAVRFPVLEESEQFLEVKVTSRHLRMSDTKALNVIRVRNERNIVSNWSIPDLVQAAASAHLYGVLRTPAITAELMSGADRNALADVPTVRALREWTAEKLSEICSEIQRARADNEPESSRSRANDVLERLRELMRNFLEANMPGYSREGISKDGPRPIRTREFGQIINEICLEDGKSEIMMPADVTIPLLFTAYDKSHPEKPLAVRRPSVKLASKEKGIVEMPSPGLLRSIRPGKTTIWIETVIDSVKSNMVEVTVFDIKDVEVFGPGKAIKQGEKTKLTLVGITSEEKHVGGLFYETSVDEAGMGHFGRSGFFTAGGIPGLATARVKYNSKARGSATCSIQISNERIEPKKGHSGADIPIILMCGSEAPGRAEYPVDQRTHEGGDDFPTIIDFEPQWQDVIWLNHKSKESLRVRQSRGPSGLFGLHTTTFGQYLAIKCFEVLRRLCARQSLEDLESFTYQQLLDALAQAEITAADFIDAAYQIVERISDQRNY